MKSPLNPKKPLPKSNEDPSVRLAGSPARRAGGAVALALLLLPGCQGPQQVKKSPIPPMLQVKQEPPEEEAPAPKLENRGASKTEIYPPSGALFGSPQQAAAPEKPGKPPVRAKEGKYTLNFDDADLSEVAKVILGDTLKVNYVISPKVTGKVSLQTTRALTEEEMIPTLEMLLKTNGAVLIHEHGLYRIEPEAGGTVAAPSARLGLSGGSVPPGFQLRVVPLRYIGVTEMQKVVEPLMPPKSVIRVDESRNLMLLAGTAEELESVLETIRIFDVDFMRGMSVGLFPLKNVEAGQVAEELEKLLTISGKGPLAGMFRIMPIDRLQAILVVTPQPRYLDEVQTWVERLDRYNTAKTGNMHVYHVQNVDALDLANTLSNIFGQGQGRARTPGASLSPGLSGSSIGGGGSSYSGGGGSSFGGSSSSGFGGSSSGLGGSSSSGLGSAGTSSGLGSSSSSGFGGTGTSSGSQFGSGSSSSGFGGTSGGTGSFGASGASSSGFGTASQGRSRGSAAVDLGNNMKIVADPNNNALIIMAKPQEYRDIESVIKQLDVIPLQVLIDATIVEVSLSGQLQYGIQWLFSHGSMAEGLNPTLANSSSSSSNSSSSTTTDTTTSSGTTTSIASSISKAAALAAAGTTGGFTYALASNQIQLLLNALASDNKINVISSPSLMVLNNQEANINVGDKVPTPTGTSTNLNSGSTGSPFVTSTIQYQDSGVTLKVRPRVNEGGLVIMEIIQELSTPTQVTIGGVTTFQFAQRKIQSQVAVSGGDTIALGGLISNTENNAESGIPYLRELPWLGNLFGSTNKQTKRTELVVLLTPRVVAKKQDVTTVTNEFRRRLTGLGELTTSPAFPPVDQGTSTLQNATPPPMQN